MMSNYLIRVDAELSDELLSAFPQLKSVVVPAHTTLTGELRDQEELSGVLNFLTEMGIPIVEVVSIPE